MPDIVTIKQNATQPGWSFAFLNADGTPHDLTGRTVTARLRSYESATDVALAGSIVIDSPATKGTGHYAWNSADTSVPGAYSGELATDEGLVLPTDTYQPVIVTPALI